MPKLRKKCKEKKKRTSFLAAAISVALFCFSPAYGAPKITDSPSTPSTAPDLLTGQANQSINIHSGETVYTYTALANAARVATKYYATVAGNTILVETGGTWRIMDPADFIIIQRGTFELESGATLDLAYKYGPENYPANPWTNFNSSTNATVRVFGTASNPVASAKIILHDGAIIRMNVGGGSAGFINTYSDRLYFTDNNNTNLELPDGETTIKLDILYNKNTGGKGVIGSSADFWALNQEMAVDGSIEDFIRIHNYSAYTDENLEFETTHSVIDGSLNKYLFESELVSRYSGTDKIYDINYTALRTDLVSQGVFSAANAQLSMRNLWRMEDGLFWKRGEELRAANRLGQGADGAWGQIWRGKYSFDGAYGSSFDQSYDGIQVGYDKQREADFYGGKLHTGLFLSMLNSDANFHQTQDELYSHANGDLESKGIGLYTSWLGDKGHYLDFTVRGSKLTNNYQFQDSDGTPFTNDYGTWTYGAGLRYGLQKELPGGWYLEPQAGLTYGTMKGYSYMQDNGMVYHQDQVDMLTGRIGVTAGRSFGSGGKRGILYTKAAVNHDFKDGGSAHADAMIWDPAGDNYRLAATLPVNTLAGKDTWYDFAIGANLQTGKDQNAFIELNKTAGGKVNTDWQVNAGLAWRFNGPSGKERKVDIDTNITSPAAAQAATAQNGTGAGTFGSGSAHDTTGTPFAAAPAESNLPAERNGQANEDNQAEQATVAFHTGSSASQAGQVSVDTNEPGTYALAPLVVEAARPNWEKKLSPGTVSVIHVPEYKGEMKNLPDLLQSVPGVYIQRLQGTGHYTVARVRGSTGGQVNIYMDGVLVNSNADAAVDLSAIPVENIERIEVYRGYVPARFAGAPIGGAINIVTKKPQDTRGSISQGMRSFGGYTGNLELTAPVGSGSMLFALNRDQARGDFRYTNVGTNSAFDSPTQERHRLLNDYQNTDALLKWQDDNWFAKLTWQRNQTSFPQTTIDVYADVPLQEIIDRGLPYGGNYSKYRYRQLDTTKTELQFGRRQTADNLEWGWKLGTSYQLKQAASSQSKNTQNNAFAIVDNDFRNRRYEGSIDGSWQAGDNHLVEFLFNTSRETMDVRAYNQDMWPPDVTSVGNQMAFYEKFFKSHYQTNTYHFQVQDTMTLNKSGNLFFTPLLRAQKMAMDVDLGDPDLGSWKYSYGLGLKKVQNEHWTFRGTYGTYYKFPNWYDLFGDGVNVKSRWEMYRDLPGSPQFLLNNFVERGTSWDISANWQGKALQADSDVTLTYFNRQSKNLSSYAIDYYGHGYYTNLGAGQIQGLELENKMNWKCWDLLLSATWNDSLVTQSGKDSILTKAESQAGNPFPWIPEWEYNIRLGYRFPGDKLSMFGEYHYLDRVGVVRLSSNKGTLFESLGITNIGLKYDINKQVKLTAGVNDLFNKGPNQPMVSIQNGVEKVGGNVYYPQQGRTYYMTAQYFF